MKDLVLFVAKSLADHPEQVSVAESEGEGQTTYTITAAEEDKGRVIGRQGRVIKALRVLAQAGAGADRRVNVEVD